MENPLPEEIIQRIQSFMEVKEAARTTNLSKSWYAAWSKRPNLDFDRWLFRRGDYERNLLEFATKTVQRYRKLELNIDSCRVVTFNPTLAKALIAEAMTLGAVDLDITLWDDSFVFPNPVFRSETLARLSLTGYFTMDIVNLKFSNLKSLSLDQVRPNVYSFRDFILRFPFLERLMWKKRDWRENKYLKLDEANSFKDVRSYKLVYLHMEGLHVEGNMFVSSDFPFLKELVILNCWGLRNVRIRSESLQRISIGRARVRVKANWDTELDIPNVKKFELDCCDWSGLVLKTSCKGGECCLSVGCDDPTPQWFASMEGVVKQLRLSKLSLCIRYRFESKERYVCGSGLMFRGAGLPAPLVVENLTLAGCAVDPAFMDKLLLICRPKLIVRNCCLPKNSILEYLLELVRKGILVEEVNVEVDQVPWLNSATARFHLRWRRRPEPSADA